MKFAIALLIIVAIASMIGTLIPQNQSITDYTFLFGNFWTKIFNFLGLFDIYSSWWFVSIIAFLIISTFLCVLKNSPNFIKDMLSYKLNVSFKSLSLIKQHYIFNQKINITINITTVEKYLKSNGYFTKILNKNQETILSAKTGGLSKLGYIFTHVALIIIFLGGILNSDIWIKIKVVFEHKVPDKKAIYPNEFHLNSILNENTFAYTSTVNIPEKASADFAFIHLSDNGYLLQILPYYITLNKFDIIYYDNGMPKDFISHITITDKKTKKQIQKNIKVNHPLRIYGTTIYQANIGDGGSELFFKAWDLSSNNKSYEKLETKSKNSVNLKFNNKNYKFSFLDFRSKNVENINFINNNNMLDTFLKINNQSKFIDVGPSINYQIQDFMGITYDYINYMLPIKQNNSYYYFYGYRKQNEQEYKWIGIPMDFNGSLNTFFLLKEGLSNKKLITKIAKLMSETASKIQKKNSIKTIKIVLTLFEINGYQGIDKFITSQISPEKQEELGVWFYQIISIISSKILKTLLENDDKNWETKEQRTNFIINSLQALSAIKQYPAPLLLQLDGYNEIKSSGLQITKSPAVPLIYLGSILLVLGVFFMFYIQQKRVWVVYKNDKMLLAMYSNKNSKYLHQEFKQHIENLKYILKYIKE